MNPAAECAGPGSTWLQGITLRTQGYDHALQTLKEIPYARWRECRPEDSLRFCALCLQEAGFTKSKPKKILAQGTDWQFPKELKKELKG
jgi:NitT/TauT family transport system substrate-binding protein